MAELKPCPFCGGAIIRDRYCETISYSDTDVICSGCGMKFSYTQHFTHSIIDRVRLNDSFEEVWNRRVNDGR